MLSYAVVGILWIAFSDRLLSAVVPEGLREVVGTTKGIAYVLVTALLAWLLLLARDHRLERDAVALGESEARYRMLAERSQDVIYRLALLPEPHFEYVSPAITAITGYTPDEHYADPALGRDMVVLEDRGLFDAAAAATDDPGPLLMRWRRRDGEVIWTEHRVTVVRDGSGSPLAVEGAARDVTTRIRVDDHHRLLTGAIDATPLGVAVLTGPADGLRVTYANGALASVIGIPVGALLGVSAVEFLVAGGPDVLRDVETRLAAGDPFDLSMTLPTQDGGSIPVSVLVSPVRGVDDSIEGVIGFIVDRSEAVARGRAEARLDRVLDASPAAIVVADEAGVVTAWSSAAERIFGRTAAETVGRAMDIVPATEQARFHALQGRLLAGGQVPPQEFGLLHRDGHLLACRVQVGLVGSDPASPGGLVTVIEDLTAQRAQERSQVELAKAIDAAGEAILITDLEGTITYVNPACEQVTGYTRGELIGQNPRILKSGLTSPATYEDLWRRLRSGQNWRGVLVNRRKDGSLYQEEAVFSPVADADGTTVAYVAVKRDLTLEHHLATGLSTELNDRAAVQEAIATVDMGETPEETAQLLCNCLTAFPGIDSVLVAHLPRGTESAVVLADVGWPALDGEQGVPLDAGIAAYVRERAQSGAWTDDHKTGRVDPRVDRPRMAGAAVVGAPIRHRGRIVGVLLAATRPESPDSWAARYVRVVSELAAHVGPLLGPALARREELAGADRQPDAEADVATV